MTLIEARGLGKRYGDAIVLDDVSFRAEPGRVTALLGPNGAGKSTVMRLMVGLAHGDGTTRFDGRRYDELERPATHVGVLLDARRTHPRRSARDHLRMVAAGAGLPSARVDEVLDLVGLTARAGSRFTGLSLGMAQRLGLAAALLGDPDTLLLDEPANGLDPQGIRWLRGLIRARADAGGTVLVSSHVLADVELMADDVVVLGRGRVVAASSMDRFVRSSIETPVLVRVDEPERVGAVLSGHGGTVRAVDDGRLEVRGLDQRRIAELIRNEGCLVEELTARPATLEDAFLEVSHGNTEVDARAVLEGVER